MKKFLCFILIFIMMLSIGASAEDFVFDIYDLKGSSDEAVLMEVSADTKALLEERLIAAWENFDTEVQLYPDIQIHKSDISALFASIYYENPQYYYVARGFSGTVNSAGYMGKLTKLAYTATSKSEVEKVWAKIDKAAKEILFYIDSDMTDFEKMMTVHDYMDLHYTYDITDTDQTYLIMLDKKGVCAAYAEAFQHMMNILGIESTLVSSDEMEHIWNMVKLDGLWYHVDVTWDDPVPDQYAEVCHEYVLLSENAIKTKGHTGFEAPYYAGATKYNNADWHDDMSALVTVGGILYRNEGNNLIDEKGNIIYKNLDGGDGKWNTSKTSGVKNVVWAGLCEVNNVLYFNTDTGIYSYNPADKKTECVLTAYGIGGLYADGNTIHYNEYDFDKQMFVKKGDLKVCGSFVKHVGYEDGKAVVKLYNDEKTPVWVLSKGDTWKIDSVDAKSAGVVQIENGDKQTIYIWNQNMEPLTEKINIKK